MLSTTCQLQQCTEIKKLKAIRAIRFSKVKFHQPCAVQSHLGAGFSDTFSSVKWEIKAKLSDLRCSCSQRRVKLMTCFWCMQQRLLAWTLLQSTFRMNQEVIFVLLFLMWLKIVGATFAAMITRYHSIFWFLKPFPWAAIDAEWCSIRVTLLQSQDQH